MFGRVFMKFLKENSYDILRLYINQVGITIFSLVLYFSAAMIENKEMALTLKVVISVFAMLFYFALLYTAAWDWGAKDKIRIDAGRLVCKKGKGALMSLIANLINFVLAAICIIATLVFISNGSKSAESLNQIFNLILRLTNAMYIGVLQGALVKLIENDVLYNLLQLVGFFVCPMLAVLATHTGYIFGLKNKRIFGFMKGNNANKK